MGLITGWTNFFEKKWKGKFHEEPLLKDLNDMLENKSIQVQSFTLYFDGKKKMLESVLAIYWVPEEKLVFKVDPTSRSLVTFYCDEDLKNMQQSELDQDCVGLVR